MASGLGYSAVPPQMHDELKECVPVASPPDQFCTTCSHQWNPTSQPKKDQNKKHVKKVDLITQSCEILQNDKTIKAGRVID